MFFAPGGDRIGTIKAWSGAAVPGGWLDCNGAAVSRATYAALFAEIGTTYGAGDGSTTFNVPDFRGRSILGAGAGPGLTARARGATGGAETHQLSVSELPSHAHPGSVTSSDGAHAHSMGTFDTASAQGNVSLQGTNQTPVASQTTGSSGTHSHTVSVAAQGGGGFHNNMPPFGVAFFIIKA